MHPTLPDRVQPEAVRGLDPVWVRAESGWSTLIKLDWSRIVGNSYVCLIIPKLFVHHYLPHQSNHKMKIYLNIVKMSLTIGGLLLELCQRNFSSFSKSEIKIEKPLQLQVETIIVV
jgi:hypothetical protein